MKSENLNTRNNAPFQPFVFLQNWNVHIYMMLNSIYLREKLNKIVDVSFFIKCVENLDKSGEEVKSARSLEDRWDVLKKIAFNFFKMWKYTIDLQCLHLFVYIELMWHAVLRILGYLQCWKNIHYLLLNFLRSYKVSNSL